MVVGVTVVSCQGIGLDGLGTGAEGTPALAMGKETDIRVRIKTRVPSIELGGQALPTARVSSLSFRNAGGGVARRLDTPVRVTIGPKGFTAVGANDQASWPPGIDVEIFAGAGAGLAGGEDGARRGLVYVDGSAFQGIVTVRGKWRESALTMDVVVTAMMETYIAGVLQKELYDGWPRQAYEAQAIAARSYALHERGRARGNGSSRLYDVESSTLDQAFGGLATRVLAIDASRATRGMILVTPGEDRAVLRAYYSACCGGRPASAGAIWPPGAGFEFNRALPLQAQSRESACAGSPTYTWEVVRSDVELTQRLHAWGKEAGKRIGALGTIVRIEAGTRNSAGKPNQYVISGANGMQVTILAEDLRVACNFGVAGERLPDIRSGATHIKSNDLEFSFSASGDVRIRGRGHGHGVGLCQYCARGFAGKGVDAPAMLRLFYPGARLERVY
jgi:stage II sporulation protein D